jgi:hypothetical protein
MSVTALPYDLARAIGAALAVVEALLPAVRKTEYVRSRCSSDGQLSVRTVPLRCGYHEGRVVRAVRRL